MLRNASFALTLRDEMNRNTSFGPVWNDVRSRREDIVKYLNDSAEGQTPWLSNGNLRDVSMSWLEFSHSWFWLANA